MPDILCLNKHCFESLVTSKLTGVYCILMLFIMYFSFHTKWKSNTIYFFHNIPEFDWFQRHIQNCIKIKQNCKQAVNKKVFILFFLQHFAQLRLARLTQAPTMFDEISFKNYFFVYMVSKSPKCDRFFLEIYRLFTICLGLVELNCTAI